MCSNLGNDYRLGLRSYAHWLRCMCVTAALPVGFHFGAHVNRLEYEARSSSKINGKTGNAALQNSQCETGLKGDWTEQNLQRRHLLDCLSNCQSSVFLVPALCERLLRMTVNHLPVN